MSSEEREAMVRLIRERGVSDQHVLDALASVSRAAFVPESREDRAYGDHALPIGHQQTISQPYIVALMTAALDITPGDRVLEVGTGSGYQAAVLAEMGAEVYTIERIPELQKQAEDRLQAQGYDIHCKLSDGYSGWPEHAPYDGIIVTAAAPEVPDPLIDQLAAGGRMVIPVGRPGSYQTLWKLVKEDGEVRRINMGGVAFVPFISREM